MTKTKRATRTEDSTHVKHRKLSPICFSLPQLDAGPTYPTCSYLFRKYPAFVSFRRVLLWEQLPRGRCGASERWSFMLSSCSQCSCRGRSRNTCWNSRSLRGAGVDLCAGAVWEVCVDTLTCFDTLCCVSGSPCCGSMWTTAAGFCEERSFKHLTATFQACSRGRSVTAGLRRWIFGGLFL